MKSIIVYLIVSVLIFSIMFIFIPEEASADVTNIDSICEVYGDTLSVRVKWFTTGYDEIDVKLFYNNVEIDDQIFDSGIDEERIDCIQYQPLNKGTYSVQVWSETDNIVYSNEWTMPTLEMSLSVSPSSGEIGTTYAATTTLSSSYDAPDLYSFSGNLQVTTDENTFEQNIGGTIFSDEYYDFYNIKWDKIKTISTSTGFTFSSDGEYSISARYTDSLTDITTKSSEIVEMVDQYNPQITELNNELTSTNNKLNSKSKELALANNKLNETNFKLEDTQDELKKDIQQAVQYAYLGMLIGLIGILIGIVGIALSKRKKSLHSPQFPSEAPQPTHQRSLPSLSPVDRGYNLQSQLYPPQQSLPSQYPHQQLPATDRYSQAPMQPEPYSPRYSHSPVQSTPYSQQSRQYRY